VEAGPRIKCLLHKPADDVNAFLRTELDGLKAKGLYKAERRITSPQKSGITVNGAEVVNFCANNYLGLANPTS
jgi:glycine C-acetyltransferase